MQQSTTLVITSTSYHKNADVERPLLNSEIDRFGSRTAIGQEWKFITAIAPP